MQQTESTKAAQAFRKKEHTFRVFLFLSLSSIGIAGYIFSWYLVMPN